MVGCDLIRGCTTVCRSCGGSLALVRDQEHSDQRWTQSKHGARLQYFWACSPVLYHVPALQLWVWAHIYAWHCMLSCHAMQWTLPHMPGSEGRLLGLWTVAVTGYTQPSILTAPEQFDHGKKDSHYFLTIILSKLTPDEFTSGLYHVTIFYYKKLLIWVADLRFVSIIIKWVWVWGEGSISNNFRNDPKHTFAALNCLSLKRCSQQL